MDKDTDFSLKYKNGNLSLTYYGEATVSDPMTEIIKPWIERHVSEYFDSAVDLRKSKVNSYSIIRETPIINKRGYKFIRLKPLLSKMRANGDDRGLTVKGLSVLFKSIGYKQSQVKYLNKKFNMWLVGKEKQEEFIIKPVNVDIERNFKISPSTGNQREYRV